MSSLDPPNPRGCREEATWRPSCNKIEGDVERCDEIQMFATDILALKPEEGEQLSDAAGPLDMWAFVTAPWPGAPSVVIYYRFDDEYVYLVHMELADDFDDGDNLDDEDLDL